jgi:hypothetical protein
MEKEIDTHKTSSFCNQHIFIFTIKVLGTSILEMSLGWGKKSTDLQYTKKQNSGKTVQI